MAEYNEVAIATAVVNAYYKGEREKRADLIHEGVVGVLKAKKSYREGEGSFLTYAYACALNEMRMYMRGERKWRANVVLRELRDLDCDSGICLEEQVCAGGEVCRLRKRLGIEEGSIGWELLEGRSQTEIAEEFGVSRQRVNNEFRRIKEKAAAIFRYFNGELTEIEAVQ